MHLEYAASVCMVTLHQEGHINTWKRAAIQNIDGYRSSGKMGHCWSKFYMMISGGSRHIYDPGEFQWFQMKLPNFGLITLKRSDQQL